MMNIVKTNGRILIDTEQEDAPIMEMFGKVNINPAYLRVSLGKGGYLDIIFLDAPGLSIQVKADNCKVSGATYANALQLFNAINTLL